MNILDFTTSKRAYMLYNYFKNRDDYNYDIIPAYEKDIPDMERYCPEVLKTMITIDDIQDKYFDVIILHSCSIFYRKYDKKLTNILNNFGGKIFCVDHLWEGAFYKKQRTNKEFKRDIEGIGIAVKDSDTDIKSFPYSQSGLDVFSQIDKFRTKEKVMDLYGLPKNMIYILVTIRPDEFYNITEKKKGFIDCIKKHVDLDNVCILCKIKEDHDKYFKVAKKYLKKHFPHYKLITKQPYNESGTKTFRDFLSPIGELCLVSDCHINISPLSYSQGETIRAGVPTYYFGRRGISSIDRVEEMKMELLTEESYKKYSEFVIEKHTCQLKVPNNYYTVNLVNNIERVMND